MPRATMVGQTLGGPGFIDLGTVALGTVALAVFAFRATVRASVARRVCKIIGSRGERHSPVGAAVLLLRPRAGVDAQLVDRSAPDLATPVQLLLPGSGLGLRADHPVSEVGHPGAVRLDPFLEPGCAPLGLSRLAVLVIRVGLAAGCAQYLHRRLGRGAVPGEPDRLGC